ncbi:hypothetical protein RJ640_004620 [Escallonia rubra]|uniref:PGG domain-containing protein n=1 Tax=Escallonia rubra TaxID=112253 RepID=A0AA88UHA2_9ASTE|nr:hypothetical protein RJ640_004620 [Escallonia rubra]
MIGVGSFVVGNRSPSLLAQPNLDGDTPLHVAAGKGQFPMVNFLVAKILSSSQRDIDDIRNGGVALLRRGNSGNNTILHEAVRNHQLKVVDLLLNVDPGLACFVNNAGESPLYLAARDGMLEIVNRILILSTYAHGGSDGQNALHAAIAEGHFGNANIIEALLRAEPQLIQETDHQGRTSLHYAVRLGDNWTARRLLELDASTAYALDKDGQSSLHIAASKGHTKLMKEIIQHSPDSGELVDLIGRNALHVAILEGKVNVIRFVLETKELEGLINQADYDGNTPLHMATMGRKSWILRLLIWDGRADRRAKNKSGKTAIDESIGEHFAGVSGAPVSGISRQLGFPQVTGGKLSPNEDQEPAAATLQTYKKMGHTVLMVATLIATVTYAAAFTMPGGYNNDVGPERGLALLRTSKPFEWFIISNSLAMAFSTAAVCVIFCGAVVGRNSYVYYFASSVVLTYIATIATAVAFGAGLRAAIPDQRFIYISEHTIGLAVHTNQDLLPFIA